MIAGEYWPDAYAVYIDYNQDGTLDESTELIGSGSSTEGFDWLTFPFTVPMSALLGPPCCACAAPTAGLRGALRRCQFR
ncbi:MAG: hypothetical protein IPM46_16330 [Flavobacteriales bacterium]|nr:hypothetical protein [Flavobacteriales bacterium]